MFPVIINFNILMNKGQWMLSLKELNQLPKIQLHDHLDGGLRPQTIIELAKINNIQLPASCATERGNWFYRESTSKDLNRCLDAFAISCSVMQTADGLERVAYEMMEDMARDNIIYIETEKEFLYYKCLFLFLQPI